ncbi:MAG: ParB/RepB/Spo0J family partition protein, partial [Chloroflexi bacterium]|nr:ParB/RepB/Spo0J family partition protein [Chloroflexota bacterium]
MARQTLLLDLDPRAIAPDPENVRREGPDVDDLGTLAASLRAYGLLQPIGVARENGGYRVVYGSRRRQAAILAELPTIPCLLVEASDDERVVRQLLENLQRRELNAMDTAQGLARLRRQLARQQAGTLERELDQAVARLVGLSLASVRRYLGLRELAPGVRDLVAEGALSATHAQHLGVVKEASRQEALARLAVEQGLSAAALARACRAAANRPNLPVEQALELGERGEVPEPTRQPKAAAPARLPRAPRAEAEEDERDLWPEEAEAEEEAAGEPGGHGPTGPATADGHRRFRIRSVSAFCDEVDRIARCLQDGELARAADQEADAPIQLRLALRQLTYAQRALTELLQRRG